MATSFPSITPTNRSFSAPIYPVTVYRSQSGASRRRLWASQPSNARLSLTFNNISDANAAAILTCYSNARGSIDNLTLPAAVFSGTETALATFLSQSGTILKWHFADDSPPKVDSVAPGRSSVSLELTASLDYS
jgi:hypothetical protein